MPVCPSCGVANKDDAMFCMFCGTKLTSEPATTTPKPVPAPPPPAVRAPPPPDVIGLVGFAIFLVVAAVVFALNPNLFQDLWTWFRPLLTEGRVTRPPEPLIVSAILFFGMNGLGGFVPAYLRLAMTRRRSRALADGLSSLGTVVFSVLLVVYLERIVTGPILLATVVGVIGVLILTFFVLAVALGLVPELARREGVEAPARR